MSTNDAAVPGLYVCELCDFVTRKVQGRELKCPSCKADYLRKLRVSEQTHPLIGREFDYCCRDDTLRMRVQRERDGGLLECKEATGRPINVVAVATELAKLIESGQMLTDAMIAEWNKE